MALALRHGLRLPCFPALGERSVCVAETPASRLFVLILCQLGRSLPPVLLKSLLPLNTSREVQRFLHDLVESLRYLVIVVNLGKRVFLEGTLHLARVQALRVQQDELLLQQYLKARQLAVKATAARRRRRLQIVSVRYEFTADELEVAECASLLQDKLIRLLCLSLTSLQ